jgi:hypothetical protein
LDVEMNDEIRPSPGVAPALRNPYAAPASAIRDIEPTKSATAAILLGAAIGNGAAYAALGLCGLVFLWLLTLQGAKPQELYTLAYQSTSYLVFAHLIGLICLVPGGYWAARLSCGRHLVNASFAGFLVAAFAMIQNLVPYDLPIPFWSRIASIAIPIPAFLIGALWWRQSRRP